MARLMITVVTLSLLTIMYSVPTLQNQGGERCWENWWKCTLHSSHGTHTKWEECNLRCQCLGWKSGYCWPSNECRRLTNQPWKCQCFGKSEFYTYPACGEKPGVEYD